MQSNFTPLVSNAPENILFKSDDYENYQKPKAKFNFLWIILGTIGIIFMIFAVFYFYSQPNKIKAFSSYFLNSSSKSKNNINSLISNQKIIPTPTIVPPTPTPTPDPFPGWLSFKTDKIIFRYPPDLVVRNQAGEGSTDYTNIDIQDPKTEAAFNTVYFHLSVIRMENENYMDTLINNFKFNTVSFEKQDLSDNSVKIIRTFKSVNSETGESSESEKQVAILKQFKDTIITISTPHISNEPLLNKIASTIISTY